MKCLLHRARLTLVLVASLLACAHAGQSVSVASTAPVHDRVRITIVGTNDTHGWLEPHDPPAGTAEPVLGGVDILGGYLRILRAQRPGEVVLLDGGDLFQGTLVANFTEGAAVIRAYNALGYDASAIGNHEFDYGPEGEHVIALTPDEDPVGNLKKRISEAHFPFLTGNIFSVATGQRVDWPNTSATTIIHREGISIGVIGMTTPTTPSVTLAQNVKGLEFRPLAETAAALAADLRRRGAQIVIITMHAGAGCPVENGPHDLSHCDPSELFPLLNALPEGTVDAVVAGHSHNFLAQFVHGVPAIQSKSYVEAFGVIELTFDRATGKVDQSLTKIWKPTPLCRKVYASTGTCLKGSGPLAAAHFLGETVAPDPVVAQSVATDILAVRARKSERLGPELRQPFTRAHMAESSLGDLVADVMRQSVDGAQVALMNSGGIRADISAGPVTYGRVFEALPFENRLTLMHLTGEELMQMLARGVSGEHGLIQVSGVQLEAVDPKAKPCGASRLISASFADGSPIIPDHTYSVVTNDFIAGGGDGFDAIIRKVDPARIMVRADLPPVREMLVRYFRGHTGLAGPPSKPEERIHIVKPSCGSPSAER